MQIDDITEYDIEKFVRIVKQKKVKQINCGLAAYAFLAAYRPSIYSNETAKQILENVTFVRDKSIDANAVVLDPQGANSKTRGKLLLDGLNMLVNMLDNDGHNKHAEVCASLYQIAGAVVLDGKDFYEASPCELEIAKLVEDHHKAIIEAENGY